MKKLSVLFFAVLVYLCVGCASTPISIAEHDPVAVASVLGNPGIYWIDDVDAIGTDDDVEDGSGLLSTLINKTFNGANPELQTAQDRVDYAVESFHHLLEENAGAEVLDGDAMLSSKAYQQVSENIFNILGTSISATGYKNLMQIGPKNARILMQGIGAKSLVLADFTFRKILVSGTRQRGQVAAYVVMKIRYLNEQGRELVNHEYAVTSAATIPISSSKYDKDELVDLFPDAIDTAINQFIVNNL